MGDPLKKVVDFLRSQDAFSGKLKVAGKDYYFTPGEGALALPASVTAAIAYWSGLQIAFNYIVNVGDALSVWTPGGPIHWVDPSGLEGPQTQRSYFDYLNFNHPGKVPRPVFDKKGKGIPDIMTTRKNLQQFYEIKPDNAGGLRDGKEKLGRIVSTLGRFFPASFYKAGGQKDILPLSLQCHDLSCGAADCKLFLEQRMDPQVDGLILYKFRVQFAIDPGPFITKAVIALAIVAAIEGGAAALSRAAGQAVGGGMIDAAEETGIRKIRVELVKRVAEHVASEGAAEQIGELGSEGVVETVYKHAIKKAIPIPIEEPVMAGETILSGSVGAGGANQPPDVGLVQILLNVMRGMQSKTLLSVDGICGPLTTAAIREFQADFAPKTGGLVDQRGATLRLLVYSYVTILRLGVYDLGRFPPSWGQLAFQERPSPRDLGAVLRVAFNDLRRGITPLLKAAPRPPSGPSRPDTRDPDRPGRLEEQV